MATKLAVIIISQNQQDSLRLIHSKLLGIPAADRYWVLDRCTDESHAALLSLEESRIIVNTTGVGFLAGKARDIGIDAVLASGKDYDAILFLDGDRVPLKPVRMRSIRKCIKRFDAALCPLEADTRAVRAFHKAKDFNPNQFISCGFLIRMECLQVIRQLDFMNNRCFHEIFDGEYGYEDGYLGKLLRDMGYSIGWSDIRLSGAIIFDDFKKMVALKAQQDKYERLYQQVGVLRR